MLKDLIHKSVNNPLFMSLHHIKSYQNKSSSYYYFGKKELFQGCQ